ncbi:secreted RxLR effector protein 161-like [Rutidosis leptorrhynchoides]|uniref:secreted RxLR effector protein 161-like n=1 Tax=Rutidosis leptorrhynchoides TaxID=125765 RepID=UPI003A99A84C
MATASVRCKEYIRTWRTERRSLYGSTIRILRQLQKQRKTWMIDCKPAATPMIPNQTLYMEDEADIADKGRYQRLVGKLIYIAHTRPDTSHAVGVVSQFMHQPKVHHMKGVIRIIRYLKKTADHGVVFEKNGHLETKIYINASWTGEKGDTKSTPGFFTLVGGNLVAWRSKKKKLYHSQVPNQNSER